MSLDVDLLAKLATLTTAPVRLNFASTSTVQPRVWVQRTQDSRPQSLSGDETLLRETTFAVEINALDVDAGATIAEQLTASAPVGMHGFRGVMGTTLVLACFVEDVSDDYQPRGFDVDDGYHVTAFSIRILT